MASNTYTIKAIDGSVQTYKRHTKQGRKSSGLGKPKLVRLREDDEKVLQMMKEMLGYLYNENEIIRNAVHVYLSNSVYTELLKQ